MSRITDFVEERLDLVANEGREKEDRKKTQKRVTVRLSGSHYAMLIEVAAALKQTNTGCAEELIGEAISEAWLAAAPRTTDDVVRMIAHGI